MDVHAICTVLQACMSANQAERSHAEQLLKQHEKAPGQVVNLLAVAVEPSVDLAVRQAAAISFKNSVKKNWEPPEGAAELLSAADKQMVRNNLVESVVRAPHIIQNQLIEAARSIIYVDFPEAWPGLAEAMYANLTSTEEARVYGALLLHRLLVRKYEFRDEEDRAQIEQLLSGTFPVLLRLWSGLLAGGSDAVQLAEFQKLICKIFWSATFMGVPDILLTEEQFNGWMGCVHQALTLPIAYEALPADPEARLRWAPFKSLKWVLHISHRLFSRFSDPRRVERQQDRTFAEMFVSRCSAQFLEDHLKLLQGLAGGAYLTPRVINLALQYANHALNDKAAYALLKPHVDALIGQVVLPQLCFSPEDATLWEEDPQEFVRKGYDVLEDIYSTKTAAANFLHDACTRHGKAHLPRTMELLLQVLVAHDAAVKSGQPPAPELARRMDGALLAIGTLNDVLMRKKPYCQQLGPMLGQYVVPCFTSPYGHLRGKACWVAQEYLEAETGDEGAGRQQLMTLVLGALTDKDLPVRVDAVVALRHFIDAMDDVSELLPLLPRLLEHICGLMHEIDSEDLVFTLESLVEKFGDQIAPYAVNLARSLVEAYWRYTNQSEDDDEDDRAEVAAYGCMKALNTLLDSVADLKHLFPVLEDILFPLMQRLISTEGQDVLEDVLDMLAYFTYFGDITPRLWSLWPQMQAVLLEWGVDYWENFLTVFDNFVSRGTEVYLGSTNPNYQESLLTMVSHALTGDFNEPDVVHAVALMQVVLENCPGKVDGYLDKFLHLAVTRLATAETRLLRDQLLLLVADALYYNAGATLAVLQRLQATGKVFQLWSHSIIERRGAKGDKPKHFRKQQDKKVAILGLVAVLAAPDAALPPEVAGGLPQLMLGVMQLLMDLKAQQEAKAAEEEEEGEEEDGEEEEEEGDDEELDQQEEEADEAYMRRLKKAARELLGQDPEDDDDDEDDWDEDNDETIGTPLDEMDAFVSFAEVMAGLQGSMPHRYQALMAAADAGAQQRIAAMCQYAMQQKEEAARKKAEEQLQLQQAAT